MTRGGRPGGAIALATRRYLAVPAGTYPAPVRARAALEPSVIPTTRAGQAYPDPVPADVAELEALFDTSQPIVFEREAPAVVGAVGHEPVNDTTGAAAHAAEPYSAQVESPRAARGPLAAMLWGAAAGCAAGMAVATLMLALLGNGPFQDALLHPGTLWKPALDDMRLAAFALLLTAGSTLFGVGLAVRWGGRAD